MNLTAFEKSPPRLLQLLIRHFLPHKDMFQLYELKIDKPISSAYVAAGLGLVNIISGSKN